MDMPWIHCYRLRPFCRNLGIACTILFVAMGLVSTLAAYFNVDGSFGRPYLAALVFGLFWSAWVVLGIWLILLYYRYRLFTNDTALYQVGVIREQHADLNLVNEMKWRTRPMGGSVRLSGQFGVVKIEFAGFESAQRKELISFLRHAIDDSRQPGWQEFCKRFEDSPEGREHSRRSRFWLAVFFLANAVAFFMFWIAGFGVVHLAASILNAVFGGKMLIASLRSGGSNVMDAGERKDAPEPPSPAV